MPFRLTAVVVTFLLIAACSNGNATSPAPDTGEADAADTTTGDSDAEDCICDDPTHPCCDGCHTADEKPPCETVYDCPSDLTDPNGVSLVLNCNTEHDEPVCEARPPLSNPAEPHCHEPLDCVDGEYEPIPPECGGVDD